MADKKDCHIATCIVALYIAATIILYLALNGNRWVSHQHGHSGLWNNCNTTADSNPSQTTTPAGQDESEDDNCNYIKMEEAPGTLHGVRATFIMGFIVWCIQLFFRYLTWEARGTQVDKVIVIAIFVASSLFFASTLLYSLVFYNEEYVQGRPSKYIDPDFDIHHTLAYVGSAMAVCVGVLNIRHHFVLASKSMCPLSSSSSSLCKRCPCLQTYARRMNCCSRCGGGGATSPSSQRTRGEDGSATRQRSDSSSLEISVVVTTTPVDSLDSAASSRSSSDSHNYSRQTRGLYAALRSAAWAAGRSGTFSGRDITRPGANSAPDEVGTVSGTLEGSSRQISAGSAWPNPLTPMALPPTYEDVMRYHYPSPDGQAAPPPTYDEATENGRELILSPPPAYSNIIK